jgi:hypothetical protein
MNRIIVAIISVACFSSLVYGEKLSHNNAATSPRTFISHRGVNLKSTIAGENSLEAIGLTARGGFGAIETDVRLTADDSLVIMHDVTLNRTCLKADGSKIKDELPIASLTWKKLRRDYVLKADSVSMRSRVPSLHEYLLECKRQGVYTFIEPKITDETGDFYRRIIAEADAILGRDNYVVTSNNRANQIVRDTLGVADVRLMSILYQTTFDQINRLGNCIMAISASRIKEPEYSEQVALAKKVGLTTESHADKFSYFDRINHNDIDFVSTDLLAADLGSCGEQVVELGNLKDFGPAVIRHGAITLSEGDSIAPIAQLPTIAYGGAYLNLDFDGEVEITLDRQTFKATSSHDLRYQVVVYGETPKLKIKALSGDAVIRRISLKIIEY